MKAVGLEHVPLHLAPQALSGGQQRRLALAIQLIRQPSVLLLDEPLAGLDWQSRAEVRSCCCTSFRGDRGLGRHAHMPWISHFPTTSASHHLPGNQACGGRAGGAVCVCTWVHGCLPQPKSAVAAGVSVAEPLKAAVHPAGGQP